MKRPTLVVVWVLLCALSIISVVQLREGWSGRAAALFVILIAAIKAQLVIRRYMEVTRAKRVWQFLYTGWTVAAAATLIIGFVLSLRS
jgi:heme/copper-type cytochrome/quinol oxidase subunit 4